MVNDAVQTVVRNIFDFLLSFVLDAAHRLNGNVHDTAFSALTPKTKRTIKEYTKQNFKQ